MAAQDQAVAAGQGLATARADRGKFTLGELADINIGWGTSQSMRQNIMSARQIKWLEDDARLADRLGNTQWAEKQRSLADKMRESNTALTEGERKPFASLEEQVTKSNEHLMELSTRAATTGLLVTPAD